MRDSISVLLFSMRNSPVAVLYKMILKRKKMGKIPQHFLGLDLPLKVLHHWPACDSRMPGIVLDPEQACSSKLLEKNLVLGAEKRFTDVPGTISLRPRPDL